MDRRSPRAIQYSIKILLEYECWGLCGEVKKFMGAWKYDQTDIERLSLIIPLHEQRSGAVHGYPITTSDKRQTPAVTNCRSIFVYRKPPAMPGVQKSFSDEQKKSSNWYNENAVWQLQTKTNRRNVK